MATDDSEDGDDFLDDLDAFDHTEPGSLFDRLTEAGVALPPPDELDDAQVTAKLWEVIHALAGLGAFLHSTDHLSDRELYAQLWGDSLREAAVVLPDRLGYAWHIDILGSGSEEDMYLIHKYYASEEDRQKWLAEVAQGYPARARGSAL
jgi:hypothetical protein